MDMHGWVLDNLVPRLFHGAVRWKSLGTRWGFGHQRRQVFSLCRMAKHCLHTNPFTNHIANPVTIHILTTLPTNPFTNHIANPSTYWPHCQPFHQPHCQPIHILTTLPTLSPSTYWPHCQPFHQPHCQPIHILTTLPTLSPTTLPTHPHTDHIANPSTYWPHCQPIHILTTLPTLSPTTLPTHPHTDHIANPSTYWPHCQPHTDQFSKLSTFITLWYTPFKILHSSFPRVLASSLPPVGVESNLSSQVTKDGNEAMP